MKSRPERVSVRLGGENMRAEKIMRDAVLEWEKELKCGCSIAFVEEQQVLLFQ